MHPPMKDDPTYHVTPAQKMPVSYALSWCSDWMSRHWDWYLVMWWITNGLITLAMIYIRNTVIYKLKKYNSDLSVLVPVCCPHFWWVSVSCQIECCVTSSRHQWWSGDTADVLLGCMMFKCRGTLDRNPAEFKGWPKHADNLRIICSLYWQTGVWDWATKGHNRSSTWGQPSTTNKWITSTYLMGIQYQEGEETWSIDTVLGAWLCWILPSYLVGRSCFWGPFSVLWCLLRLASPVLVKMIFCLSGISHVFSLALSWVLRTARLVSPASPLSSPHSCTFGPYL